MHRYPRRMAEVLQLSCTGLMFTVLRQSSCSIPGPADSVATEMLPFRKQCRTSVQCCFLEPKQLLPNQKSLSLYKEMLHL